MSRPVRVPASFAGPSNQDHEESHNQEPAAGKLIPWRGIGAGATSIGMPVGIGLLHPAFGVAVFLIELAGSLVIGGTALFGAKEYSERAFRLLRWIGNRPEPDAPPGSATGQVISLTAGPGPSRDDPPKTLRAEIVPLAGSKDDSQEIARPGADSDATDLHQLAAGA